MSLEIKNACFGYRPGRDIFCNVDLKSADNDVLCILGPNGCGKTTLLKCISGILRLKQGDILLDGQSLLTMKRHEIAALMGYIPQEHATGFAYKVIDIVLMGRTPHLSIFSSPSEKDYRIAEEAIAMVGVSHLIENKYTEISGGERQLVLIARTLAQQPKMLLLDEPTSHLDFRNQAMILKLVGKLARSGLSVIMTSHFPDHALAYSGQIALMHQGNFLAQGLPGEVVNEKTLEKIYGIGVKIFSLRDPASGEEIRFCRAA
jgi:iron complex transport system ATP-binding protein